MRRVAVVGGSLAAVAAVESLREGGFDGALVMIGDESFAPYDRPPLSKEILLGDSALIEQVALRPDDWAADHQVELRLGQAAVGFDAASRRIELADGSHDAFDGVVIATGANAIAWPSPESGVLTLRTFDDAVALRAGLAGAERVVIVGGGFIGLEVATAARAHGVEATVVDLATAPLQRGLGPVLGPGFAARCEEQGIVFRGGVGVERVERAGGASRVFLSDGSVLEADLVVAGVGARPATAWLADSGLPIADGVVCDSRSRTPAPGVVAAGDIARWAHPLLGSVRVEHWENAVAQGAASVASLLHGDHAAEYAPVPYVWSDLLGVKLQIVGSPGANDAVTLLEDRLADGKLLALYSRDGQVTGAAAVGRGGAVRRLRRLLSERHGVAHVLNELDETAAAIAVAT